MPRLHARPAAHIAGLAAALLIAGAQARAGAPLCQSGETPVPGDGWALVWADEFDAAALDDAKWTLAEDCWGGGNDERQCYTASPDNHRLEDGCLIITARPGEATGPALNADQRANATPEDAARTTTKPFTSARLRSKNKAEWTYARIEARARLPEGQGAWPAIWMMPTHAIYGGWAASGEIDIMEVVNIGAACEECPDGRENHLHGTIHFGGEWPDNENVGAHTDLPPAAPGEQPFHVFAIEWTQGQMTWFLNGEPYSTLTADDWSTTSPLAAGNPNAPFDQAFHLILNFAVGGRWPEGENEGGVEPSAFPEDFVIDWVRVYQCVDDPTGVACRTA